MTALHYLPLELLTAKREVTRRQIVKHGKEIYRSVFCGKDFARWNFSYALSIAEQELNIASHIPSDQIDKWTMIFRLGSDQPMGRQSEGEMKSALSLAISNVKRLSPDFYSLPMIEAENKDQIVAYLKAWNNWHQSRRAA